MRNLTRVSAVLVGIIAASSAASVALVACSTDPSGIVGDSGVGDATPDHTTGKPDHVVSTPDTGNDVVVRPDVVTIGDTGVDAGKDSGDSGHDSGHDAIPDVQRDVQPDVTAELAFPAQVNAAYCNLLAGCCGGADAGFNVAACNQDLTHSLVVSPTTLGLLLGGIQSDNYVFDQAKATTCLNEIEALTCDTNAAGVLNKITTDCAAVYTGKLGQSATGCKSSFDCTTGTYCAPLANGSGNSLPQDGGGTCSPLSGKGERCVDTVYSSDCTYLGSGSPGLFCNPVLLADGGPGDGGICAPALGTNGNCFAPGTPEQCLSQLCVAVDGSVPVDGGYACETTASLTNPDGFNLCTAYAFDGGT